jgi:glycosyltransferase involved in cell wall biosynthesis
MERLSMKVSVDARPLDVEGMRSQGIGRYAHGLLGPLADVAEGRGGRLTLLRQPGAAAGPFGGGAHGSAASRALRRPPLPARAVELAEQALLPLDLARLRPDVHHSLSPYRTPLVSPGRVVVTVHDVAPLQWPEKYLKTGLAHRTLYRAVRRAAGIVCVSAVARQDLLRHLDVDPERVWVVPEAAGERFHPCEPGPTLERLQIAGPYLVCVGSLDDPRKDVQGLIDAFEAWAAAEQRMETLVLAGAGDASALRIAGRVKLPGFVPEPDLPALYSGASCFVTASRYEGFGLGALEALRCGTPVVAYDAGAIPETAGPGALLAPPGDGAALMRAAGRVCDEAVLAERLAGEGRRHATRFSWRRTAELTWDVYERVA